MRKLVLTFALVMVLLTINSDVAMAGLLYNTESAAVARDEALARKYDQETITEKALKEPKVILYYSVAGSIALASLSFLIKSLRK
jgi:hypothetical protein